MCYLNRFPLLSRVLASAALTLLAASFALAQLAPPQTLLEELKAVVQGGPVADYFSVAWQKKALGTREYLFGLFDARSAIYGVKPLQAFLAHGPRMSLRREGFLGKPSAPMLLINGAMALTIRRYPFPTCTPCCVPEDRRKLHRLIPTGDTRVVKPTGPIRGFREK